MGALRQVLDVLRPRAFVISLVRGSWTLLVLLVRLLLTALRRASSRPAAPAAGPAAVKSPPAKVSVTKTDAPPAGDEETPATTAEETPATAAEEPPTTTGKPKTGKAGQAASAGGDRVQDGSLLLVILLVTGGGLSSLAAGLLYLLRPYLPIVATVLVLTWIAAALTADAVTHPKDDHGGNAGEDPQEDETEEDQEEAEETPADPWPAQRELLRKFVEHRVTAGASGFTPGVKGRGAQVDDLLAEQQRHGGLIGMERKGMIELLWEAGITVRQQMKFNVREDTPAGWKWKERNRPGVHIDDLAKDLGRTPNMPAHLVPDLTPAPAPVSPPDPAPIPAQESPPIPLPRAAGQ